jgi:hypothetical protein
MKNALDSTTAGNNRPILLDKLPSLLRAKIFSMQQLNKEN